MTNPQLQRSLVDLAAIPQGLAVNCAKTIDGRHLVEFNADEVFPAAGSIKLFISSTLLKKAEGIDKKRMIQADNIAQTVLSMAETACQTEITTLPQRSPHV